MDKDPVIIYGTGVIVVGASSCCAPVASRTPTRSSFIFVAFHDASNALELFDGDTKDMAVTKA